MKLGILYSGHTTKLSYNDDWLDAFVKCDEEVEVFNTNSMTFIESIKLIFNFDYIVMLHSTNSNSFKMPKILRFILLRIRRGKLVFFVGNEYKNMREKVDFIINNRAEFVISQLPQDSAEWLYEDTSAQIVSLPHALNEGVFHDVIPFNDRPIDIGNRSYEYPWYLGDLDRMKTLAFIESLKNINVDISTDPDDRFTREEWAEFLNHSKFTVASEAGSSFLERDDKTRLQVNEYLKKNPNASFEDVYEHFFQNYNGNAISGKCISARHFDAIGTKTCQILLEGRYNDILEPNIHYIELKRDFSNIDNVLEKMQDVNYIEKITKNAYDYVINNHTHQHRIDQLLEIMRRSETEN